MKNVYHTFRLITKLAFIVALIGFVILSGALLMFSGFLNPGEGSDLFQSIVCGWVYLIGSIIFFSDRFSLPEMAGAGIILNLFGAAFWVSAIGSNESYFAVIGILLTVLWCICVALRIIQKQSEQVAASDR